MSLLPNTICENNHHLFGSALFFSVDHDAADAFPRMHHVKAFVDLIETDPMRDHRINGNLSIHIPVDNFRNVGPPTCSADFFGFVKLASIVFWLR